MLNKKFLFIAGTLGNGGAERQLYYILKVLKENGATLQVLSIQNKNFWEKDIVELGIQVVYLNLFQNRLSRLIGIIKAAKAFKPDIIQSVHFYTNFYAAITAWLLRVKDIGAIRGDGIIERRGGVGFLFNLWTPRIIAANSKVAIARSLRYVINKKKFFYLKNVIDAKKFYFKEKQDKNEEIFILTVGRLDENKGVDLFIKIIARLYQEHKLIRGLIVGSGPSLRKLEMLSEDLGVSNVVRFLGEIKSIETVYQSADIFVMTSLSEGMPNVVMEAMASGLPVVTSDVGEVAEILKREAGYVVDRNVNDFTVKISTLVNNQQLRIFMGRNARRVIGEYDLRKLKSQLEKLYNMREIEI